MVDSMRTNQEGAYAFAAGGLCESLFQIHPCAFVPPTVPIIGMNILVLQSGMVDIDKQWPWVLVLENKDKEKQQLRYIQPKLWRHHLG